MGGTGSVTKCNRRYSLALVHFQLPDIQPSAVDSVEFSFTVIEAKSPPNLVLYGLGERGSTEGSTLLAQTSNDFYVGENDTTKNAVLIDREIASAASFSDGQVVRAYPQVVRFSSKVLTDYVRSELALGAGGQYIAFRLNGADSLGCDQSCGDSCLTSKYVFLGGTTRLTVSSYLPTPSAPFAP